MPSQRSNLDQIHVPNYLDLFESTLIRKSVGVIEFCEKFCNRRLYPRQRTLLKIVFLEQLDDYDNSVIDEWEESTARGGEVTLAPKLRDRIQWCRDNNYDHFNQIILVGGRRSSKGHITGAAIGYKLYLQTLLDNPGAHYGIDLDKDIYFNVVAQNEEEAIANQFSDAVNWLLECKPLTDQGLINNVLAKTISVYTPYDKQRLMKLEAQHGNVGKDLAKLKVKAHGTNSRALRGQAVIGLVLDEMAHLLAGESRLADAQVYEAAMPGVRTFGRDGIVFLNSSPYTKVGKFHELYSQALELDPPDIGNPKYPDMFMIQMPSWELYRDWEKDPEIRASQGLPEHKWIGAVMEAPELDPVIAQEELRNPDSFKVEYRGQFAEVVDAFLNPEMVDRMFDPSFTKQKLGKYLDTTWTSSGYTMYLGHMDPATVNDNFAICIGHKEEITLEDGMIEPHVVLDLVHAFYPTDFENHTIDWLQVMPVIEDLLNNFRPFQFTSDQFQSTYPLQELRSRLMERGILETVLFEETATQSKNFNRAMNFKAALNLGRIHCPHPDFTVRDLEAMATDKDHKSIGQTNKRSLDLLRLELKMLQQKPNNKIEHQDIGICRTDDIYTAISHVVHNLIGDSINNQLMNKVGMEFGGYQGYSIGDRVSGHNPFADFYAMQQKRQYPDVARGGRFQRQRGKKLW